ncbi:MAG TPA: TraR/DksA C4-type zinc finger protein [Burkholderiaceae bacterium]|nr:TraR/DksA C4-type zinc finger protein [Burkholderiaceae bacterium]
MNPTPAESDRIRRLIESRLDELRGDIADKLDEAAAVSGDTGRNADSGDLSVADDTATGDFADARRDVGEYQEAQAALARLEAGDYGTCVDCGEEIPSARLEARPFAARCIACQERAERVGGVPRSTM